MAFQAVNARGRSELALAVARQGPGGASIASRRRAARRLTLAHIVS
ncbi:hypothetical protein [Sorangium sp. So ce513]